ncbi:MAG: tetratricopeptide repeat protein [Fervidobacterium sp.]
MPIKLPILAEDLILITDQDNIPIEVILRGLEEQYNVEKIEYWLSYLVYFYYEKFKILLNEKRFTEAEQILNKVKSLKYDYRYHFYNALLQGKMGNYELAEVEFKQSLALNPDFQLAYYELGNVLFAQKDYDAAIESYKKAYELDKNFLLPLLKVGDIYVELNQLDDAEIVYKNIVSQDKIHGFLTKEGLEIEPLPEAYLRLGIVYNLRNQYKKAEQIFKEGLNIEKKPEIMYNLSFTLTRLGKHQEAYKLLYDLSKEFPTPEVLNELGILQRRLGLYEEAYNTFEKIKDDFPENFERIEFFVGKRDFESEYINELKTGEKALESVQFPFEKELEIILDSTDDEGNVLVDKFIQITKIEPVLSDNHFPSTKYVPYIIAGMYIAGVNPIVMEKNATKLTVALMGSGLPIACTTALLRLYQFILSGQKNVDHFLEEVYTEIEELHFEFSKELVSLTEKPLDDFFISECTSYDSLILNVVKAVAYNPNTDEFEHIKDELLKEISLFLTSLMRNI